MIKSVNVNGVTYNIPQASAANQRTVMTVLSRLVMAHSIALAKQDARIDCAFIKGVLLTLDEPRVIQISDMLLGQCVINGTTTFVDIKTFQGQMNAYYTVMAEAVCHNLADFFTWLDEERTAAQTANPINPVQ